MELELKIPQLDALTAKVDDLNVGFAALHEEIKAINKKLEDRADPAVAAPVQEQPEVQPKPRQQKSRRQPIGVVHASTETVKSNGHDAEISDEAAEPQNGEALRALVEFEAKRTSRQFGIGGTRAAIGSVVPGVLRVDDVPTEQLAAVLSALQAL